MVPSMPSNLIGWHLPAEPRTGDFIESWVFFHTSLQVKSDVKQGTLPSRLGGGEFSHMDGVVSDHSPMNSPTPEGSSTESTVCDGKISHTWRIIP